MGSAGWRGQGKPTYLKVQGEGLQARGLRHPPFTSLPPAPHRSLPPLLEGVLHQPFPFLLLRWGRLDHPLLFAVNSGSCLQLRLPLIQPLHPPGLSPPLLSLNPFSLTVPGGCILALDPQRERPQGLQDSSIVWGPACSPHNADTAPRFPLLLSFFSPSRLPSSLPDFFPTSAIVGILSCKRGIPQAN